MKLLNGIKKVIRFIDKITDQGDCGYDFSYDAAQKTLFVLLMLILFIIPWGDYRFAIYIFCSVGGRLIVMPYLQRGFQKVGELFAANEKSGPFLWIPRPIWKIVVLAALTYILIEELHGGDFFAIPAILIMYFIGFFIYAGYTALCTLPPDPNRRGSPEWKKANGVQQVGFNLMNPLWRDKYGNYYKGTNYVPIIPPVNVVNKDY